MGKIILHEHITPEGFCDHRAGIADDELLQPANDLMKNVNTALFGRGTFQLFESYWPSISKNQKGSPTEIEFAGMMDKINKIVFSKTIAHSGWQNTTFFINLKREEILNLKRDSGEDIIVFGSPDVATQLMQLGLIDEYHFYVQPFIFGKGGRFFNDVNLAQKLILKLTGSRTFKSGVIALYYQS